MASYAELGSQTTVDIRSPAVGRRTAGHVATVARSGPLNPSVAASRPRSRTALRRRWSPPAAMELELHRVDLLQTGAAAPGCLRVLPPGEKKTQKVAVADAAGVVQCFSVKKGEVALAFKTMPGTHKVRGDSLLCMKPAIAMCCGCTARRARRDVQGCCAAGGKHRQPCRRWSGDSAARHALPCAPLFPQITSLTLGRHPRQRDKIFIAGGGVVSGTCRPAPRGQHHACTEPGHCRMRRTLHFSMRS